MLYLDTSAFLKLVVEEAHSRALRRYTSDADLWASTLLAVEAHRAALRLGIPAELIDQQLEAVTLVVPSETTFESARSIGSPRLRSLDALHLAAALELGDGLEAVVTYDGRLAEATDDAGILVVAPGLADRWWQIP